MDWEKKLLLIVLKECNYALLIGNQKILKLLSFCAFLRFHFKPHQFQHNINDFFSFPFFRSPRLLRCPYLLCQLSISVCKQTVRPLNFSFLAHTVNRFSDPNDRRLFSSAWHISLSLHYISWYAFVCLLMSLHFTLLLVGVNFDGKKMRGCGAFTYAYRDDDGSKEDQKTF